MESSLIETLIVPWWKVIVYSLAIAVSILAIRISIKVDLNKWSSDRRDAKLQKEKIKLAKKCMHAWTLYPSNHLSFCSMCHAGISTSILMAARLIADVKPIILAAHPWVTITPPRTTVVVSDYIGGGT